MTQTSTMTPTQRLSDAGVSIWLDDLSRERIQSGSLKELIKTRNVVGVPTNPTIFAAALAHGEAYAAQISDLAGEGTSAADAVFEITSTDVALAADILRPIYVQTQGFDGRVSIECAPVNAHRADATVAEAKALWSRIDRHNVMIKIPATAAGLEAITAVIGAGISVNVTLIFSLDRYREVIEAYLAGLERAKRAGLDMTSIHSVASFFVSRLDTEIDRRLDAIGTDEAHALRGQAGIANARLAYEVYQESFTDQRAQGLIAAGANEQRPLWASTGVKDPTRPDTMYVVELAASDVVNTMPEQTLEATHDHGNVRGDTITGSYPAAVKILDRIAALGISYAGVTDHLEEEGLNKFRASWNDLLQTVRLALEAAK